MIVYDPMAPDSTQGRRSDQLVQSIDIAATMLDYAGIERPETFQGKSLRGLVTGSDEPVRDYVFTENLWSTHFGNPRIEAVQDKRWKYIRYYAEASIAGEPPVYEELYDIVSDPGELHNLIDDTTHAETLKRLKLAWKTMLTKARGTGSPKVLRYTVDSEKDYRSK
ncbi:hypothetical protein RMSM_07811 [Rhodopirellula maiorica SM1]|uniref:N-sulphoglucosamine sulphohydrolase C-terminal domain-containing protein n=2 Tax=Novipirellula TaxID=2795426 RepID=M5R779_9BACT|nr:hypothetical protein RMSM_07811 [Rhodopirellula maiorica SM1]